MKRTGGRPFVNDSVVRAKNFLVVGLEQVPQIGIVTDFVKGAVANRVAIDDELGGVPIEVLAQVIPRAGDDVIAGGVITLSSPKMIPLEGSSRCSETPACGANRGTAPFGRCLAPHEEPIVVMRMLSHVDRGRSKVAVTREPDGVDDQKQQRREPYPPREQEPVAMRTSTPPDPYFLAKAQPRWGPPEARAGE